MRTCLVKFLGIGHHLLNVHGGYAMDIENIVVPVHLFKEIIFDFFTVSTLFGVEEEGFKTTIYTPIGSFFFSPSGDE